MRESNQVEIDIRIVAQELALRQLQTLREDLFSHLRQQLPKENVKLEQAAPARGTDPTVVGLIAVTLSPVLPVIVEKAFDLLKEWLEAQRKKRQINSSLTVQVTLLGEGGKPGDVTMALTADNPEQWKESVDTFLELARRVQEWTTE